MLTLGIRRTCIILRHISSWFEAVLAIVILQLLTTGPQNGLFVFVRKHDTDILIFLFVCLSIRIRDRMFTLRLLKFCSASQTGKQSNKRCKSLKLDWTHSNLLPSTGAGYSISEWGVDCTGDSGDPTSYQFPCPTIYHPYVNLLPHPNFVGRKVKVRLKTQVKKSSEMNVKSLQIDSYVQIDIQYGNLKVHENILCPVP